MECVKSGEQIEKLTLTIRPMSEKPKDSGDYVVIWHACDGTYNLMTLPFSSRYGLWGTGDLAEDAHEAVKRSNMCFHGGKDCVGWTDSDITQLYEEDGEF